MVFRRSCKPYKHTVIGNTHKTSEVGSDSIRPRQDPKHLSLTVSDPCDDLFTNHTAILKTTNIMQHQSREEQRLSNVHLLFSFLVYISSMSVQHRTAFQPDLWHLSNIDSNIQMTSLPPCLYITVISSGLEARQQQTDSLQ